MSLRNTKPEERASSRHRALARLEARKEGQGSLNGEMEASLRSAFALHDLVDSLLRNRSG